MIPKRIISMWLGDDMPQLASECVATHKVPGFEHMWINNHNFDEYDCTYLRECLAAERFAKATDYIRMAALEKYGGIYLDADVKVLKPLDDLLGDELFVCEERNYFVANSVIGAVPHHPLIQLYLRTLTTNFLGGGDLVFQPGMGLWTELIRQHGWAKKIKIYPTDYFFPYDHQTGLTNITPDSYTIHYYLKSWVK
jgi:mannosyltransferase OCH1-like enzyme